MILKPPTFNLMCCLPERRCGCFDREKGVKNWSSLEVRWESEFRLLTAGFQINERNKRLRFECLMHRNLLNECVCVCVGGGQDRLLKNSKTSIQQSLARGSIETKNM